MSKTPRTDEHLRMKEENGHVAVVSRDFARQLETELADKEKQLAEARAATEHWKSECNTLQRIVHEAQAVLSTEKANVIRTRRKELIDLKKEETANSDLGAVRRSCSNCEFFESFRAAYYDYTEPDDEGFCRNGDSPRYGNEGANSGYVCDFHNYA